jgi:AhpC/TSA antioxidant enzyme
MDLFRIFICTAVIHLCLLAGLVDSYTALNGVLVTKCSATSDETIDIGAWLMRRRTSNGPPAEGGGGGGRSLLVFGTYAADFNAVEYAQRLKYYWPLLRDGPQKLSRCALVLNCRPAAAAQLQTLTELPDDIELWVDNTGRAGRAFGVERGWLPDNADVNPFLKLFGMLLGLGAWATLPAVIGGYIGNPFVPQPWITDALAVGIRQGRWPDNSLEFAPNDDEQRTVVVSNKFDELPLVGNWPRRPLELATLRLQSMLGISLKYWSELAPDQEALDAGVLTQLGGCLVTDANGATLFEWRDPGICAVANFEDILKKLS